MNLERKKLIQEKRDIIKGYEKDQLDLIKKLRRMARLDEPIRMSTTFKRCAKMVGYALSIRQIELHKQIVISQPIPNFESGSAGICEIGKEIIKLNK